MKSPLPVALALPVAVTVPVMVALPVALGQPGRPACHCDASIVTARQLECLPVPPVTGTYYRHSGCRRCSLRLRPGAARPARAGSRCHSNSESDSESLAVYSSSIASASVQVQSSNWLPVQVSVSSCTSHASIGSCNSNDAALLLRPECRDQTPQTRQSLRLEDTEGP